MNCLLCESPLSVATTLMGERDFCGSRHRSMFHSTLRKGLQLVSQGESNPLMAKPLDLMIVSEIPALPRWEKSLNTSSIMALPLLRLTLDPQGMADASAESESENRDNEAVVVRVGTQVPASVVTAGAKSSPSLAIGHRAAELVNRLNVLCGNLKRAVGTRASVTPIYS